MALVGVAMLMATAVAASAGARQPTPFRAIPDRLFEPVPTPAMLPTLFLPTTPPSTPRPTGTPVVSPRATSHSAGATPRPTPRPSPRSAAHQIAGWATYYCCTAGYGNAAVAAAGPALRAALGGDPAFRGKTVRVCADGRCESVRLVDWCACRPKHAAERLIDLEPAAFAALAPLSRGVIHVTVSW